MSARAVGETCGSNGSCDALMMRMLSWSIESPRKHVYAHVGRRTDVRVWGFIPLPRSNQYRSAEWVNDSAVADAFLIYCPPVRWLSECWREIARDGDPRLHPSAWRSNAIILEENSPTSGASAKGRSPTPSASASTPRTFHSWVFLAVVPMGPNQGHAC